MIGFKFGAVFIERDSMAEVAHSRIGGRKRESVWN